jgi:hypothetical protein
MRNGLRTVSPVTRTTMTNEEIKNVRAMTPAARCKYLGEENTREGRVRCLEWLAMCEVMNGLENGAAGNE